MSDADLKKAYEERQARFETPERRHVQQIVFPNMEEARAAADKLAKGTTFEALAAERGLKEADIDLGTVAKTAIVDRAVADAAFALKDGEVSAPVEGRFGIALVQVGEIEPAQDQAVRGGLGRAQARDRHRARQDELVNVQDKIEDERLGGATLAEAARKFNLKPRTIEAIDRSGKAPDGKAGRRPAAGRRRAGRGVLPPRSAATTIRCGCRAAAATSGTTSPRSRRRASARSTRSRIRSRRAGATTRSRRG